MTRIKIFLGIVNNVDMSKFDTIMIEYQEILKKRKSEEREKEGSLVTGMECDPTIEY